MSSKITIIGAGSVGATIAYTLSSQDIASEIVLIDINKEKVAGEVMDIIQGTCFRDPISIIAGDYEDAKDSDIVIITSGIARKPGQTRLELTQTNVNILKSITPEIVKAAPNALYLIVSNPVDIMTYVFTKISGLPENQILGSGTILDSARLRCGLSEHFRRRDHLQERCNFLCSIFLCMQTLQPAGIFFRIYFHSFYHDAWRIWN